MHKERCSTWQDAPPPCSQGGMGRVKEILSFQHAAIATKDKTIKEPDIQHA